MRAPPPAANGITYGATCTTNTKVSATPSFNRIALTHLASCLASDRTGCAQRGNPAMSEKSSSPTRRSFLASSAAMGTLLATSARAQSGGPSVRPFSINFPEEALADLRRRINADQVARTGTGLGRLAGRAARDNAGTRTLLGNGARLAQGGGAAQRLAASSSLRSTGSTFTSFMFARSTRTPCR